MKGIKVYTPPERAAPVARFIDSLEPRLREKLIRQLIELPRTPRSALREPHFKHFTLERYRELYELRERGKVLVRVIFTIQADGGILLLHGFVKRQQSLNILARLREHPELAAEYVVKEEQR